MLWIAAALLYPLALTWLYFIALADVPAPWPQLAYGLGKAVQFGPALWWLARVRPDLLRPRGRTTRRDLAVGAAFGAVVALALFAVYTGRPFDLLGPSGHAAFAAAASDKAATLGIASPVRFLVLGLFYALLHSGLEEAYWRGLVFTAVRDRTRARTAVWVSSIAFTLHHIVLVTTLLPGQLPLALLLAACVGIGGAAWSVQRSVARSLLGAWLGHGIVDAAIFAVGGWVLFGAGAGGGAELMGTPTLGARAITWASPYPSATPAPITSRPSLPAVTTSTPPTATVRPTVDPAVPLPVAMTLEEARAKVLSWLDPGHAPRILSADYVPGAAAFRNGSSGGQVGGAYVADFFGGVIREQWLERVPATLVRVVADIRPLVKRLPTPAAGSSRESSRAERFRVVAWFDALSGARLAIYPIDRPWESTLGAAPAEPTVVTTYVVTPETGTATPTPRPSPTFVPAPTPLGSRFDAANVPPTHRDVLTAYPLLPGSSWTWDVTRWEYATTWFRVRVTETVTGAWQLDDRHVIARSAVERTELVASPLTAVGGPIEIWRTVAADGVVTVAEEPASAGAPPPLLERLKRETQHFGLPIEALGFAHENRYVTMGVLSELTAQPTTVTTPAGRFDGCGLITVVTSAGSGSVRAICPGVGYVSTETYVGHVSYAWNTVAQLVSYDVVLPR